MPGFQAFKVPEDRERLGALSSMSPGARMFKTSSTFKVTCVKQEEVQASVAEPCFISNRPFASTNGTTVTTRRKERKPK